MMIARWRIEARFGQKDKVIALLKQWNAEIAPQVGLEEGRLRTITGSVGVAEAVIEEEFEVKDLTELDEMFKKMGEATGHAEWGAKMEPHVVSGSSRWEIYRVV
jgi:hypothetical protein